jgi:hypothetical protein
VPKLRFVGPALKKLRGKQKAADVARRMRLAKGDDVTEQALKNRISRIESAGKPYPTAVTIDAFLEAIKSDWLALGREVERLSAASGAPSKALDQEGIADDAEGAVDDLIRRAADESATRTVQLLLDKIQSL